MASRQGDSTMALKEKMFSEDLLRPTGEENRARGKAGRTPKENKMAGSGSQLPWLCSQQRGVLFRRRGTPMKPPVAFLINPKHSSPMCHAGMTAKSLGSQFWWEVLTRVSHDSFSKGPCVYPQGSFHRLTVENSLH